MYPTRACARAPRSLRPPRQAWSSPRLTRRAGYPPPFTPVSRSDRGECRRARKCDGPISAVYCCGGRSSEIACGWWSPPSSLRSSLEYLGDGPLLPAQQRGGRGTPFSANDSRPGFLDEPTRPRRRKPKPRMVQRPRRPCTSGGRVQNGAVPVKGWRYSIGPRICR